MKEGFYHGGQALSAQVLRVLKKNHDQFVSDDEILEDPVVRATSVMSPFLRRERQNVSGAKMAIYRAISYLRRKGIGITSFKEGGIMHHCWVE